MYFLQCNKYNVKNGFVLFFFFYPHEIKAVFTKDPMLPAGVLLNITMTGLCQSENVK